MNAQYITDKGFARYMAKYIANKRRTSHVFNISENELLRENIVARRLACITYTATINKILGWKIPYNKWY
jgi:hypothetical protein